MKKSKLLIPALSIASVGAVVAPMVTSCAKESFVDLEKYESTIERYKDTAGTVKDNATNAAKAYYDASNAAELIKNDLLVYLSYENNVIKEYLKEYEEFIQYLDLDDLSITNSKANISNIEVKYTDGTNKATISGYIHLVLDANIVNNQTEKKVIGAYHLETTHELKKVPYEMIVGTITPETGSPYYRFSSRINTTAIKTDVNWSIRRTYSGKATYNNGWAPASSTDDVTWSKDYIPTSWLTDPMVLLNYYPDYLFDVVNTHA